VKKEDLPMQMENCDVCGKLTAALHECRLCKRRVCEEHFKPQDGLCSQCYSRLSLATQVTEETWVSATLFKLFFLGFFLMFVGVVVLIVVAALQGGASASGGLVIFIGPFPIILGAGPNASLTLLFAVILTIVGFVVFFWLRKTKA
jgi:uncharacterized membrane protein